ncbi:hypothetical protein SAMD00023353_1301780 [Rosellinia necatrix]|uniref:Uncharacterized protein n=1 Tax=Rosellinia necatrix TaxID=77044 RepID=A0A1S8A6T3_ROSNE|nr:hypothetical protein SAMD00023353_1301780 [Rosellinia necatrix]
MPVFPLTNMGQSRRGRRTLPASTYSCGTASDTANVKTTGRFSDLWCALAQSLT